MGCLQDGIEARQLLSWVLLGIDGPAVCLWGDEPVMGCRDKRPRLGREDRSVQAIGQQRCRSRFYRMGSMACFRGDVTMTLVICANSRSQARWVREPDAGAWWTPQLRRPKELSSVGPLRYSSHLNPVSRGSSARKSTVAKHPRSLIEVPLELGHTPLSHFAQLIPADGVEFARSSDVL